MLKIFSGGRLSEVETRPLVGFSFTPVLLVKKLFLIASGMVAVLLGSVRGEAIELDPLDFRLADRSTQRTSPMPKPKASVELSFDLPNPALRPKMPRQIAQPQPLGKAVAPRTAQSAIATLFDGGSDSLVAKTVGHAEGTRTAAGGRTRAYYGHIDPGNGVWNLGSFSYQHCYRQCTPEEADDRQLQRLRNQSKIIQQKAADYGMQLSLEEKLNGIDLAIRLPWTALDQGGYRGSSECRLPKRTVWLRCCALGQNLFLHQP
ncbi:MAG: hypothetical protein HC936_13855 [Leptolyngbyaceae cyanobacterium SU_3_3]|nr:hypothetical protein [Leptolyngbyaceae cyanobacterium SU_3_3]